MNQKEYELIAEALREVHEFTRVGTNVDYLDGKYECWRMTVSLLSSVFERNYPSFDRDKFRKACGL